MPIAAPNFSWGTIRVSMIRQVTGIIPPGTPCANRKRIMKEEVVGEPAQRGGHGEPDEGPDVELFEPIRVPTQALIGTMMSSVSL